MIKLRSGERIDIDLSSTMPDPHVGFYCSKTGTAADGSTLHVNYTNYFWFFELIYIQVVNEAKVPGDYSLEITITTIDTDNNGLPETAEELPLDTNEIGELSVDDINDLYDVEIRSGYNLTVMFNAVGFAGYPIFCALLDEQLNILEIVGNTAGTLTYSNPDFESTIGYVQFYNLPAWITSLNETESLGDYHWNATLVNNDPDGDFNKATTLTGPSQIVNDDMFANVTFPTFNISDINDFYKINLGQGDVLSLAITITGVGNPWFEVYVYDEDFNIVRSATGADSYELLLNVGDAEGVYYIRFYNRALDEGDYTLALSVYTDTDSYFAGATPITPGPQNPDDMSDIDLADFFSIQLEPGWRIKVNASLTGTGVFLFAFDPDQLSVMGDVSGGTHLEIEFTAEKSGSYYIEFFNDGGNTVDYNWWVDVYEDENGVFATATSIADGDIQDSVQELDKFDYFVFSGTAGESFTITCTLPPGLNLHLILFNSTEGFIDEDLTGPGLAITYLPAADETFYLLVANPTGDTGDYTFTLEGAGAPPGPTTTPTDTTPTTDGGFMDFFNQEWLGLKIWLWFAIGGGALLVIIISIVIGVSVAKKRKGRVR
ncbi:MAG: hypothetical protein GF308_03040 [Candidatus Heimdallarchaeota archaeon]|nr:hypothetical protein [Candidatus Heimdallarchaeota archaeon]